MSLHRLSVPHALAVDPLRRFLAAHAVPGLERHDLVTGEHTRVLLGAGGPVVVTFVLSSDGVDVALPAGTGSPLDPVVLTTLQRWLDLDADMPAIEGVLSRDPLLAPLVAARPGLRVPGAIDGFETAVLAVLGQQVSLAAARTFAGRLVAAVGTPSASGFLAFPTAEALADADPEVLRSAVGVTAARGRTVQAVARAVVEGLDLRHGADAHTARTGLLAVPGIGPWTADYVALRVLGDRDAYPADDLVLKRALGVTRGRDAARLAERWSPWRSYALLHLWTAAVFS